MASVKEYVPLERCGHESPTNLENGYQALALKKKFFNDIRYAKILLIEHLRLYVLHCKHVQITCERNFEYKRLLNLSL